MELSGSFKMKEEGKSAVESCFACRQKKKTMCSFQFYSSVFVVILLISTCSAQKLKLNKADLLKVHDSDKGTVREFEVGDPVSLMWGIADTSAVVGKLFNFAIPNDAFKGTILDIKVTEAGKHILPGWLYLDPITHHLKGIPTPADIGPNYIEVTTRGPKNSNAKDVFSINVVLETPPTHVPPPVSMTTHGKPQIVRCKREEPETSVTVVVDTDMNSLSVPRRIDLVSNFTTFLNLAMETMKMLPLGNKAVFDSSALVAGPGDVKTPTSPGLIISWLVGCGKVEKDHMTILQKVELTSANGKMKTTVGHSIVGWHVTNTALQEKPRRRRRAVMATATPDVTPSPPTRLPDTVVTDTKIMPSRSEPLSRTDTFLQSSVFKTEMIKPSKSIDMPSASPTLQMSSSVVMTKMVTEGPREPTTIVTSKPITPAPTPEKTPILPTKSMVVTDAPTKVIPEPTDPYCPDDNNPRAPYIRGKMEEIVFPVGRETQHLLPPDLFFDCHDGKTNNLRISLFANRTKPLSKNSWVNIKGKTVRKYKIAGLPMLKHVGYQNYSLTAQNSQGLVSNPLRLMIKVIPDTRMSGPPSHKISMTFDTEYEKFTVSRQKDLTRSLAQFMFGDDNADAITVLSVEPGSVVYSWTNNQLPTDKCPAKAVSKTMNKFVNEDGSLNSKVNSELPYKLKDVKAVPMGACIGNKEFPGAEAQTTKKDKPATTPKTIETEKPLEPEPEPETPPVTTQQSGVKEAAQGTSEDEIWITTVVPAVVIVAILLIALIIACVLYRKRRKGKMSLEEKNAFVSKGAPVIFPDEYDEKPNDASKPLIMDEEKPPIPPPEYTRASSESSRSSDNKNEQEEYEMNENDITSPLYQPPPPVPTPGSNKQPRPHMQAAYKNPTPYVPP